MWLSVPPGFYDSAIAEIIAKSSKRCNFCKSSQIFIFAADFGLRRVPWRHRKVHSAKERLFISLKNLMNTFEFSSCPIYKELHWTNWPKVERIRATRLICSGCSRSCNTVIHSAGRYSEERSRILRGINNISVRSCEKNSNSVKNSIKATDIRTNATDVETRRNIIWRNHGFNITTGTTCGLNRLMFSSDFKCFTQLFSALEGFKYYQIWKLFLMWWHLFILHRLPPFIKLIVP